MPENEIITLDEAQVAAERFLEERLKILKIFSVDRVKLSSAEGIIVYEAYRIASISSGIFAKNTERRFKVHVPTSDSAIIGL